MSKELRGYAQDTSGQLVSGATAELYAGADTTPTATVTTDSDGYWSFSSLSDDTIYHVKIYTASWVQWRHGDVEVQAKSYPGYGGTDSPLADGSIPTSQLANGAISTTTIDAEAVTNAKVASASLDADRFSSTDVGANFGDTQVTVDDTTTTTTDSNTLGAGISAVAHYLKAASGESGWKATPATTMSGIVAQIDALVPTAPITASDLLTSALDTGADLASGSTQYVALASFSASPGLWLVYWRVSYTVNTGGFQPDTDKGPVLATGSSGITTGVLDDVGTASFTGGGVTLVYTASTVSLKACASVLNSNTRPRVKANPWDGTGLPVNAIYGVQLAAI